MATRNSMEESTVNGEGERSKGSRAQLSFFLLLLLLSTALRLAWLHVGPRVIESEGVYYARVGENLALGRGLVGIRESGLQLLYPPLYSLLIAVGVLLGASSEQAGRCISLVFGCCLPLVAAWLGRRLHGARVGWIAGGLAAVHPLLIATSAAVLTESTYLTLSLLAVCFVVLMLPLKSAWAPVASGSALGLAYLCRPEGMLLTILLIGVVVLLNRAQWRAAVMRSALLLGVFALFAVPYITFLYRQTGQLRFEAKTADGLQFALRQEAGQSWGEIYFGVDKNLVEYGSVQTSNLEQLQSTRASLSKRVALVAKQTVRNVPHLLRGLADLQLGQPILSLLIGLAFFGAPWDRGRVRRDLPLLAAASLTLLTFGTWPFFHDRFLFPIVPALVIWSGLGLKRMGDTTRATIEALGVGRGVGALGGLVPCVCVAALCIAAAVGVRRSDELSLAWSQLTDEKPVGAWVRAHGGDRVRLMDTGPTAAFYADAVLVMFPWTDAATALRYIESKRISFLILRDWEESVRPYFVDWLKSPPDVFDEVAVFPAAAGQIHVYRYGTPVNPHAAR